MRFAKNMSESVRLELERNRDQFDDYILKKAMVKSDTVETIKTHRLSAWTITYVDTHCLASITP